MLLRIVKLYAPIMEHPTTLQYDFTSVKLRSFFCKKSLKEIYIFFIFHFSTSQPHNVHKLLLLFTATNFSLGILIKFALMNERLDEERIQGFVCVKDFAVSKTIEY